MVLNPVKNLEDQHRYIFRAFRIITGLLLILVIWDPIPGLLTQTMQNDWVIALILLALVALTAVVSYDFVTRTQKGLQQLIFKYFFLMTSVILLFGTFYVLLEARTDNSGLRSEFRYTPERDAYYFSAMTYLTVGYGDYVPYGAAKTLSVFEAAAGNIINLVLLAIAVTRFKHSPESQRTGYRK